MVAFIWELLLLELAVSGSITVILLMTSVCVCSELT
jgi:hypothetical protein